MRFLEAWRVGMIVAMVIAMLGIVAISAAVVAASINEGDSASAWIWAAVFVLASVIATWVFWKVL